MWWVATVFHPLVGTVIVLCTWVAIGTRTTLAASEQRWASERVRVLQCTAWNAWEAWVDHRTLQVKHGSLRAHPSELEHQCRRCAGETGEARTSMQSPQASQSQPEVHRHRVSFAPPCGGCLSTTGTAWCLLCVSSATSGLPIVRFHISIITTTTTWLAAALPHRTSALYGLQYRTAALIRLATPHTQPSQRGPARAAKAHAHKAQSSESDTDETHARPKDAVRE
jgi:hypothetical protein